MISFVIRTMLAASLSAITLSPAIGGPHQNGVEHADTVVASSVIADDLG